MSEMLPKGWANCSLGDILYVKNGYAFKSKTYGNDGIPLIRISEIKNGEVLLDNAVKIPEELFESSFTVKNGDLLIAMSGATTGKTGVYKGDIICLQNQRVGNLKLWSESLTSSEFRNYIIKSHSENILKIAYGGAQPNISGEKIESININLPPLAEQKRIAVKLDCLLAKVDACKKRLDKVPEILKRFRQSVLADAVSGKLTEDWRSTFKQSASNNKIIQMVRFERRKYWEKIQLEKMAAKGKLPKNDNWKRKYNEIQEVNDESLYSLPLEWEWVPWELVLAYEDGAFKRGPFGSAIKKAFFVESGYKVYEQYCPINDDPSYVRYYISEEKYKELETFAVRGRDFIISCSGVTLGRITQIPENFEKGVINQALLRVRLNGKIINDYYFKMMFRSPYFQRKIFDNSTGSAQPNVKGVKELKAIPIPLPPIEEQKEIIRRVEELYSVADQMEEKLTIAKSRVDNLTASILSKAFRGRLVPQDPSDEPAEFLLKRIRAEQESLTANKKKGGRTPKNTSAHGKRSKPQKEDAEGEPEHAAAELAETGVVKEKDREIVSRKQAAYQTEKRFDKTNALKAFRKAIFHQNDLDEYTLLRHVGQRLNVRRLSEPIRQELESYIRIAIRRKIIVRNNGGYDSATPSIHHYDEEYLINALKSLIRKGYEYQRGHVVENLAVYLGYDKVSDAFAERMKNIFRLAIRRGDLYRNGAYVGKF